MRIIKIKFNNKLKNYYYVYLASNLEENYIIII